MADTNANIRIGVDTSDALAQIKNLQRQISLFHSSMANSGKAAADQSARMQTNLVNSINATRGFTARMTTIKTTTESFTNALEKNKLSMGEYFRFAGASTKRFGNLFKSEFNTIEKVARERVKDLQTQFIKLGRDASGAMKGISVRPTTLDMKNLGTQTAIAAQKQQLFNQLMKQGSTNMLNWGKNTQWAGRQLMVGFTIPLTIFGTVAAKTFMQLEEQAIKFKRVYGDMFTSTKEVDEALEGVRKLATEFTKFGVAVEDTIELAASVAQMGAMGADLTNQVTEATRLAVLGGIEQQKALDTTVSLTNAFGLATEELSGKIAFLNAVENQTILSIEDFNEAIPKAGSVVKQLGGDVEDLAYFLTAMREGGVNASQSANALKSSLARLINPTEVAQQKLRGFGIDILGIVNNNAGNLRSTIQVLAQELDKLDPLNKSRAIEQLFGKFQFARMSTLFENIVKEGSQANKVLELTTNSTEELAIIAERELGKVADSPAYKFKKAMEEFKAALAPIGKAFLEIATPLIEFGKKVLDQFNGLSDGAKQFIVGLTAISGVVAPAVIMVVGLMANAIANTIKFGLMIRNAFGKSKNSSQLLTSQFEYMNQEQIEAAAVAASLDQVHSKLRQTFTSEAAAVDRLTAAYTRAIEKQRLMMMSGGGKGRGGSPKKYNQGVVSVPGSGSRDTVPAMLTPGEAVIPAGMAERYAPIIQAMIEGNIPGYNKGKASGHIAKPIDTSNPANVQKLQGQGYSLTDIMDPNMQFLSDLTMDMPDWVNNALKEGGGGVDPDIFVESMNTESMPDALTKTFEASLGESSEQARKIANDFQQEIVEDAAKRAKEAGTTVTDDIMAEATDAAITRAEEAGAAPKGSRESKAAYERRQKKAKGAAGMREKQTVAATTRAKFPDADTELRARVDRGEAYITPGGEVISKDGTKLGRTKTRASRAARDAARPGFKTKQVMVNGKPIDVLDDPKQMPKEAKLAATEDRGKNVKNPYSARDAKREALTEEQRKKQQQLKARNDANEKVIQEKKSQNEKKRQKQQKEESKTTARRSAEEKKQGQVEKQRQRNVSQQQKNNATQTKVVQKEQVNAKKLNVVERMKERSLQRQQQRLTREQAVMAGANQRMAPGGASGAGRMAGIGMAASTAVMMGGMMPGQVGEIAQSLMMPVMALSMALPLLTGKFGPLIAIVGTLGFAVYSVIDAFNKGAKRGVEMAEAFGYGTKAMEDFAEAAGNATAGQIMDKRRETQDQMLNIQPGKATFGETFLEGDVGAELLKSISSSVKSGGSTQELTSALVAQMGTAIATGALEAGQARSIVGEIAEELGNYQLGIAVNGELLSLFGPDGENLLENPLEIRVKLIEAARENIQNMAGAMPGASQTAGLSAGAAATVGGAVGGALGRSAALNTTIGRTVATSLTKVLAGAVGRSVAGAVTGSVAGPVGTVAGAIVGIGLGVMAIKDSFEEIGALAGGFVVSSVMALQQQQELLDSLQIDYEKRIAIAEAAGDAAEAERLQNQYIEDRAALLDQNKITVDAMIEGYRSAGIIGQTEITKVLNDQIKEAFKDDPLGALAAEQARQAIEKLDFNFFADSEREIFLKTSLLSGDLTPGQLTALLSLDESTIDTGINLITKLGTADSSRAFNLMSMFVDKDGKPNATMQSQFLLNVDAQPTSEAAIRYLDLFAEIGQVGQVADMQIVLDYYMNDPNAANRLNRDLERISQIIADSDGVLSIDMFANLYDDPEAHAALEEYAEYFKNLPPVMQREFIQAFTTIYSVEGSPAELSLFRATSGNQDATQGDMAAFKADQLVREAQARGDAGSLEPEEDTSGGGGGPKASPLDNIMKKLRDLRMSQIEVTKGWVESRNAIDKLFGGGKDIEGFKGIEQQMRGLGQGEDLISMIVGMDPDDYERRKKELFQFDKDGNIVGITTALQNMGKALRAVKLGEYQSQQEKTLTTMNDNMIAFQKLRSAGLSTAEAYEALKDAEFAAAVAREKNNKKIKETVALTKEATRVTKAYQAAQAVANKNLETADKGGILKFIQNNAQSLSEAQKTAILSDKDLQTLVMNPSIDPETLREALKNAENEADLELKIKKTTFEGLLSIFNDGFNNAMEAFSVQEKKIELDFKVLEDPFLEAIKDAEQEIADIRNSAGGLDDLEADLERISWQEEDINKKYDERQKALTKVQELNKLQTDQQKSQLDVAEALSRGDIAAAAKAAQEYRAKQLQATQKTAQDQLDISREKELAAVVAQTGLNRKQIQEEVERLNRIIFEIEERRIEPAQRQLELLGRQKEDLISNLEVLGKTRSEWERIKNNVDLARINNESFVQSMRDALDVVTDIVNYWDNFPTDKTVDIFENVTRKVTEIKDPEPAPAPPPTPDPGTGGGDKEEDVVPTPTSSNNMDAIAAFRRQERLDMQAYYNQPRKVDTSIALATSGEAAFGPWLKPILQESTGFQKFSDTISSWRDNLLDSITGGQYTANLPQRTEDETQRARLASEKLPFYATLPPGRTMPTTPTAPATPGGLDPSGLGRGMSASAPRGGSGRAMDPIRQDAENLNKDVPNILSGVVSFFRGIPKTTEEPISRGVGGNLSRVAGNTPNYMAGLPAYFGSPLKSQVQPAISTSIGGSLKATGDKSPSLLSRITSFFKKDVPDSAQESVTRKIPAHFTTLSTNATQRMTPIQTWIDKLPGKVEPKLTSGLTTAFTKIGESAPKNLNPIPKWFGGLADSSEVRSGVTRGLPSVFSRASTGSVGSNGLGRITSWFSRLRGKTQESTASMPTDFGNRGQSSGSNFSRKFIDLVNRQFNNFRPEVTITQRVVTIYETQRRKNAGGMVGYNMGGMVGYNMGGMVAGFNEGGGYSNLPTSRKVPGSGNYDKVKTLLTPGEFVIRQEAVEKYGQSLMQLINSAKLPADAFTAPSFSSSSISGPSYGGVDAQKSGVMYNSNSYAINVNVKSEANPDQIARTVMNNIKRIDSQRIRSNRL